ncbi:MAG: ROK family protein [Bacteroidetes bacterium]|nr:ROK family protein [Bacteroidota bacterium]
MEKTWVCLGVDIGGTTTNFGFVDMYGKVHYEASFPTRAFEPGELHLERLHYSIEEAWDRMHATYSLEGIGIGAPNGNFYQGTIVNPPNLNWGTIEYAEKMKQWYSVPIRLTNDANAAAFGELQFGGAQGLRDFMVITLGTGLGSGIVANGDMIYGFDGFAGEVGHTVVIRGGRQCGCGRRGCLETYASASGIRRTAVELMADLNITSELRAIPFTDLNGKRIAEAAQNGDELALEAFKRTGDILGMGLADAVAYTAPEAIILVGGLAKAGDLILKPTRESFEAHVHSLWRNKIKIKLSGLADGNIAILGAAALIWREIAD